MEVDLTIKGSVCLLPKIEHLGMALTSDKKYISQMMNSQKPQAGCIQVDIRPDGTVTDYRIPFRALLVNQNDSFDEG